MIVTTCKDMGGPCDAEIKGNTPEEVIENGNTHVMSTDDEAHKKIVEDMKNMSPEEMAAWSANEKARLEGLAQGEDRPMTDEERHEEKEVEMI